MKLFTKWVVISLLALGLVACAEENYFGNEDFSAASKYSSTRDPFPRSYQRYSPNDSEPDDSTADQTAPDPKTILPTDPIPPPVSTAPSWSSGTEQFPPPA